MQPDNHLNRVNGKPAPANMFGQQSEQLYRSRAERSGSQPEVHNIEGNSIGSPEDQSPTEGPESGTGTWGERDVGGPVNTMTAFGEYEALRKELTQLSLQRTKSRDISAARTRSRASLSRARASFARQRTLST